MVKNSVLRTAARPTNFAASLPSTVPAMTSDLPIRSALISVYDKTGLDPLVKLLNAAGVTLYSTGGTRQYLQDLGIPCVAVESVTGYPSILGGRVKTLHPGVFGGILARRDRADDRSEMDQHQLPYYDLVVVDLYPFEATVAGGGTEAEIIEKIDIGGISLIRAAAKNYQHVAVVASRSGYSRLETILSSGMSTNLAQRKALAVEAFDVTSHYDAAIYNWIAGPDASSLKVSAPESVPLRYGENPHQQGRFFGKPGDMLKQLSGKELSYNNLLDVDAAVSLMDEFDGDDPSFAILKHNNACGVATRSNLAEAYAAALACDPVSAFGGVLVCNRPLDAATAAAIHPLFCEVVIAPGFEPGAAELLMAKPNRILLERRPGKTPAVQHRTLLNGILWQQKDLTTETRETLKLATHTAASENETADLIFAAKIVKHTRSNAIVLAKNKQLCASGTGQTSRVDALQQAIEKAGRFGFDLHGAVMASDAFFPFPDCVEIAGRAGISAVIQPGGSVKDQLSVDYCNQHGMSMYLSGTRHFRH